MLVLRNSCIGLYLFVLMFGLSIMSLSDGRCYARGYYTCCYNNLPCLAGDTVKVFNRMILDVESAMRKRCSDYDPEDDWVSGDYPADFSSDFSYEEENYANKNDEDPETYAELKTSEDSEQPKKYSKSVKPKKSERSKVSFRSNKLKQKNKSLKEKENVVDKTSSVRKNRKQKIQQKKNIHKENIKGKENEIADDSTKFNEIFSDYEDVEMNVRK